jgi:CO/xanthine dehydrogenase Mo-binding subunit
MSQSILEMGGGHHHFRHRLFEEFRQLANRHGIVTISATMKMTANMAKKLPWRKSKILRQEANGDDIPKL